MIVDSKFKKRLVLNLFLALIILAYSVSANLICTMDQQQNTTSSLVPCGGSNWYAQSFTPNSNTINRVDLHLKQLRINAVNISLKSSLTGPDLGEATVSNSAIPDFTMQPSWISFNFTSSISIIPGNTYYIVIKAPQIGNLFISRDISNPYLNGTGHSTTDAGSTWANQTYDLAFKTYECLPPCSDDDNDTVDSCDEFGYPVSECSAPCDCNDSDIFNYPSNSELCDNQDNDCDSLIDENFTNKGQSCSVGLGVCQRTGVYTCNTNGSSTECDVIAGLPTGSDNDCNGIDEDCDGVPDNNYIQTQTSCGVGSCASTGQLVCVNGQTNDTCIVGISQPEICDNLDNNCNNQIDENLNQSCYSGPSGTQDVGICQSGTQSCSGGIWSTCFGEITPQTEVCDGFDDNCNNLIDDMDYTPELILDIQDFQTDGPFAPSVERVFLGRDEIFPNSNGTYDIPIVDNSNNFIVDDFDIKKIYKNGIPKGAYLIVRLGNGRILEGLYGYFDKEDDSCECKGKVSDLTLKYTGSQTAIIEVIQKNGDIIFQDSVDPGSEFSLSGTYKETLGTEITIKVNNVENTKIHTSCSKPIGPGLVSGDFEVVSGESKEGGTLCSNSCGECKGKVTDLILKYNGSQTATIKVVQKDSDVIFEDFVSPGSEFSLSGTYKNSLGTEITLYINDVENTKIHTSCSKPVGPGLISGDFEVVSGKSKYDENLCPVFNCWCDEDNDEQDEYGKKSRSKKTRCSGWLWWKECEKLPKCDSQFVYMKTLTATNDAKIVAVVNYKKDRFEEQGDNVAIPEKLGQDEFTWNNIQIVEEASVWTRGDFLIKTVVPEICTSNGDSDSDGVHDSIDECPATGVDSAWKLKSKHFMWNGTVFVTEEKKNIIESDYSIDQTRGCSCDQILAVKSGKSKNENKYGCTKNTMNDWINMDGWTTATGAVITDISNGNPGSNSFFIWVKNMFS